MQKRSRFFSVSYYLLALLLMMVVSPFLELSRCGSPLEAMLITLVFLSALLAIGAGRKTLVCITALTGLVVMGKWLHYYQPGLVNPAFYQGIGIFIIGYTAYRLLLFISRSPRVDSEVLCAGVAVYLTLGVFWALAYSLVDQIVPGSFTFMGKPVAENYMVGFTALYFSFATLCTVGYGDIMPVSGLARMLAILEAAGGVFYVAILISRLVALHSTESLNRQRADADQQDHGASRENP